MRHTTPRRACLAVSMEAESTRHDAPASLLHSCCAQVPFADRMPLQAAVAASVYGRRPNLPSGTPPLLAALVARCWHATPAERPPFESVQAALAELRGSCMRRSLSIGSLGELRFIVSRCIGSAHVLTQSKKSNGGSLSRLCIIPTYRY